MRGTFITFDTLPDVVKDRVYRRLDAVLTGQDGSPDFSKLSDADRTAIREILDETRPECTDCRAAGR